MRVTILPKAIIMTKAHRAVVSIIALSLLPNYTNSLMFLFQFALFSDEPEVFLPKHSQAAILHAAHFRRVVNSKFYGAKL